MKTIFVVQGYVCLDRVDFLGSFSSEDKAREFIDIHIVSHEYIQEYWIIESIIDNPPDEVTYLHIIRRENYPTIR